MRKPLVMGNWKMNLTLSEAKTLCESIKSHYSEEVDMVVCPSYPYLSFVASVLGGSEVKLGAQNVSAYDNGAYTGDVSSVMLEDVGCKYVLAGHSERRAVFGETDETVLKKVKQIVSRQMTAVLCVGETLEERQANRVSEIISRQLNAVLNSLTEEEASHLVIAYEPVWAIGTGLAATPEQVQEVHNLIRKSVAKFDANLAKGLRIVYGGSVKSSNAKEIFSLEDVDGGLIGGASLKGDEFIKIVKLAICEK
jgi:triosephosphate isomerase (TIM)